MVGRIGRLVVAEGIKLGAQRFLYVSIPILAVVVLASAYLQPILTGRKESVWSPRYNSYQLFSYGAKFGVDVASYILVIFSSMLFAGEFDRGTIKNLLTRPVTRTDVFLSKVIVTILLTLGLYLFVLSVSFLYGAVRGDLGPVWDTTIYEVKKSAEVMDGYAWNTVVAGFFPLLAAACLGILISSMSESSGYAVATALVLFLVLNLVTGFLTERLQLKFFNHYLTHGFDVLRRYAEGEGVPDYVPDTGKEWFKDRLYLKIPLLYIGGFLATAYAVFRTKNIHA